MCTCVHDPVSGTGWWEGLGMRLVCVHVCMSGEAHESGFDNF